MTDYYAVLKKPYKLSYGFTALSGQPSCNGNVVVGLGTKLSGKFAGVQSDSFFITGYVGRVLQRRRNSLDDYGLISALEF